MLAYKADKTRGSKAVAEDGACVWASVEKRRHKSKSLRETTAENLGRYS